MIEIEQKAAVMREKGGGFILPWSMHTASDF